MSMGTSLATIEQTQGIQAIKAPENLQQFQEMLGPRAPHFITSILGLFATSPKLIECTPESVVIASLQGAAMDLSFDPNIGEAYMVPYNKKVGNQWMKLAQYQPGYKGLIQLALRTGQYKKLGAQPVTREAFNALRQRTESSHEDPAVTTIKFFEMLDFYPEFQTGRIYGYIAYFELINGFPKFVFWTQDKCLAHAKKYSKQQDKQGNLYGTWVDSLEAMCLKTVIRQLLKWGPKSKEIRTALEFDSKNLVSDFDRLDIETGAPKRLGHEDEDLFGSEPEPDPTLKTESDQRNALYTAIETLVQDRATPHKNASFKKNLQVENLRDCTDVHKLYQYYEHVRDTMASELIDPVGFLKSCTEKRFDDAVMEYRNAEKVKGKKKTITADELDAMLETVGQWLPERVDEFVSAAETKNFNRCQALFDEALKTHDETQGGDVQ